MCIIANRSPLTWIITNYWSTENLFTDRSNDFNCIFFPEKYAVKFYNTLRISRFVSSEFVFCPITHPKIFQ